MLIQYRYDWKWWGNTSPLIYDLDVPGSRQDLQRVINEIRTGKTSPETFGHRFYKIKSIGSDEVLKVINKYPTHDSS